MKKVIILLLCLFAPAAFAVELLPFSPGEVLISGTTLDWKYLAADRADTLKYTTSMHISLTHRGPGSGEGAMTREFDNLDCSGFDQLVFFFNCRPFKVKITMTAETDKGQLSAACESNGKNFYDSQTELVLDLKGAKKLKKVTLNIVSLSSGTVSTEISAFALMLRNRAEHAGYLKHWQRFENIQWAGYLWPESYTPQFKLQGNLLFSDAEADVYRKKFAAAIKTQCDNLRGQCLNDKPERIIFEGFFTGDTREYLCNRYRELLGHCAPAVIWRASSLAFAGYLAKDKQLLRLAARYALAMSSFLNWDDHSGMSFKTSDSYSTFTAGRVALHLAFVLDCAGEMLTPKGRNLVLKALMLKAVMPITLSCWLRPFTLTSNQGLSFIRGKMAALLMARRYWQDVDSYVAAAKAEADKTMEHIFKPDGGYMESTGYFNYTILCGGPLYEMYASSMGRKLSAVLPEGLNKSSDYGAIIISQNKDSKRQLLTIGDCIASSLSAYAVCFMAAAVPDSSWVQLYKKLPEKDISATMTSMGLGQGLCIMKLRALADRHKAAKPKSFIKLPSCGLAASIRQYAGEKTKLVVVGDAWGLGKKHHDSGSFILEYAGDVFAEDMSVYSGVYSSSEFHNMLVPVKANGTYGNNIYFRYQKSASGRNAQIPQAKGDDKRFSAEMDAGKAWEKNLFQSWKRTVDSPEPGTITISDAYKLGRNAKGAAFIYISSLPAKIEGDQVIIIGNYGAKIAVCIPQNCKAKIEGFTPGAKIALASGLKADHKFNRIIFTAAKREAVINVKIKLLK